MKYIEHLPADGIDESVLCAPVAPFLRGDNLLEPTKEFIAELSKEQR